MWDATALKPVGQLAITDLDLDDPIQKVNNFFSKGWKVLKNQWELQIGPPVV